MTAREIDTPVLIVGAGPVGLFLANELAWRGVPCVVLEQQDQHALNFPTANNISIRTMEHLRRWGLAARVHETAAALPYGRIWLTSIGGYELARFDYPTNAQAAPNPFSPETFVWCPKPYFDPLLAEHAASFGRVQLHYGWQFESFEQDEAQVAATFTAANGERRTIASRYLVGCDGAGSAVRKQAGLEFVGLFQERGAERGLSVYFRAPELNRRLPFVPAHCFLMNSRLNRHGPGALLVAIDGQETWRTSFDRRPGEEQVDPVQRLREVLGPGISVEILDTWRGAVDNRALTRHYRSGRVFVAGDAAHVSTPRGGLGANTGMQDAVDLGWKLAAIVQGWGGTDLLDSYEAERRPVAIELLRYQGADLSEEKAQPVSTDIERLPVDVSPEIEQPTDAGGMARRRLGRDIWRVNQALFTHPGIELGYRYEASPICIPDGTPAPPSEVVTYTQTARPGSRAPHAWLDSSSSTLDLFGRGFTLLRIGGDMHDTEPLEHAARERGIPLRLADVNLPEVWHLYQRRLTLVRPDGFVAWRGDESPPQPLAVVDQVRGA